MSFLLLDAMRDYLTEALAGLPLCSPAVRGREARLRPPQVLIGELPPQNKQADPAAERLAAFPRDAETGPPQG